MKIDLWKYFWQGAKSIFHPQSLKKIDTPKNRIIDEYFLSSGNYLNSALEQLRNEKSK